MKISLMRDRLSEIRSLSLNFFACFCKENNRYYAKQGNCDIIDHGDRFITVYGGDNMCLICDRIEKIKNHENPYFVKELETGYVVIGDNQHFRGYTLFLCKQHKTELFLLEKDFAVKYMQEMILVAEAVRNAFGAEKMNYECLGQGDAHLHWHLFPRRTGDIENYGNSGRGPVWWYPMDKMYTDENRPTDEELSEMKEKLLAEINKLSE